MFFIYPPGVLKGARWLTHTLLTGLEKSWNPQVPCGAQLLKSIDFFFLFIYNHYSSTQTLTPIPHVKRQTRPNAPLLTTKNQQKFMMEKEAKMKKRTEWSEMTQKYQWRKRWEGGRGLFDSLVVPLLFLDIYCPLYYCHVGVWLWLLPTCMYFVLHTTIIIHMLKSLRQRAALYLNWSRFLLLTDVE